MILKKIQFFFSGVLGFDQDLSAEQKTSQSENSTRDAINPDDHFKYQPSKTPLQCQYCPSNFHREVYLRHHEQYHIDMSTYECKICEAMFASLENWLGHISSNLCASKMLQKSPNEAVEKKPEITARFEDTFFKEDFDDVEPDAKRIKMNDDY